MLDFQCWLCGEGIEKSDKGAVLVSVENLWAWESGEQGEDDPLQQVYMHSACAKNALQGSTMNLEPETFLD